MGKSGKIWMTHHMGISQFDIKTEKFKRFHPSLKGKNYLPVLQDFKVFQSKDSDLYIDSYSKIFKFDGARFITDQIEIQSNGSAVIDKNNNIYYGGIGMHSFRLNDSDKKIENIKLLNELDYKIAGIVLDGMNKVWVGSNSDGIFRIAKTNGKTQFMGLTQKDNPDLIKSKGFRRLFYIKGQGIYAFSPEQALSLFDTISMKQRCFFPDPTDRFALKLPNQPEYSSFYQDKGNVVWFTSYENGASYFDLKKSNVLIPNIVINYLFHNHFILLQKRHSPRIIT